MADTPAQTPALPDPGDWLNKQNTASPAAVTSTSGLPDPDAWLGKQQKPVQLTGKEMQAGGAVDTSGTISPFSPALHPEVDAALSGGSEAIHHILGVYHMLRSIPKVGDKLPEPNDFIKSLGEYQPQTPAGYLGKYGEDAAEFAVPETEVAKAAEGANLLVRSMAHAATSAGVRGLQTEFDPTETAVAGAAGAMAPTVGNLIKFIGSRFVTNPDVAFTQAVRPRNSDVDFMHNSPTVRGDIKQAAGKKPIEDLDSLLDAVDKAKAINRGVLDMHLDPARKAGITVDGSPIADAISEVPASMHIEAQTNPDVRRQIAEIYRRASAYDRPLTIDQLKALGEETNAKLNSFYHATPDAQNAMISQGEGKAALESKAKAIRDIFRNTFGDDASDIQRRWGLLDDVEAAAKARKNPVIMNETSSRPVDEDVRKLKSLLTIKQDPLSLATTPNKTNNLIKRTFAATEPGGALPTPRAPGVPFGTPGSAGPQLRLPPPGTVAQGTSPINITPGNPQLTVLDSSGKPIHVGGGLYDALTRNNMEPSVDQYKYGPRQITGSTAPYTGTPEAVNVPDVTGSSSRGEGTPTRLIESNKEGILYKPRNPNSTDFNAWEDPRAREIIAPGETPRSWLPSAPGQPAAASQPEARIISKRGEAVPNTERISPARPLSTQGAVEYLRKAGWDGKSASLTEDLIREARKQAVADGYRISLPGGK